MCGITMATEVSTSSLNHTKSLYLRLHKNSLILKSRISSMIINLVIGNTSYTTHFLVCFCFFERTLSQRKEGRFISHYQGFCLISWFGIDGKAPFQVQEFKTCIRTGREGMEQVDKQIFLRKYYFRFSILNLLKNWQICPHSNFIICITFSSWVCMGYRIANFNFKIVSCKNI